MVRALPDDCADPRRGVEGVQRQGPAKYGIRGIPTLMLFKNGAVVGTKVGALSKSQLTAFIDSNI
jgi:thioredoxin-like negative regulator of GroEL